MRANGHPRKHEIRGCDASRWATVRLFTRFKPGFIGSHRPGRVPGNRMIRKPRRSDLRPLSGHNGKPEIRTHYVRYPERCSLTTDSIHRCAHTPVSSSVRMSVASLPAAIGEKSRSQPPPFPFTVWTPLVSGEGVNDSFTHLHGRLTTGDSGGWWQR